MNISRSLRKIVTTSSLALVAIVGFGAGASHAAPEQEWPTNQEVSGRIVDAKTNAPLAGKKVVVYSYVTDSYASTRTDENGKFVFRGLTGDEFAVAMTGDRTHCAGVYLYDFWGAPNLDGFFTMHDWVTFSARNLGTIGAFRQGAPQCGIPTGYHPFI